jgi:hypothetical protein
MLEPSLDILYGLFLGLFIWGSWECQTRTFKDVDKKEEDDKDFLVWVIKKVELVGNRFHIDTPYGPVVLLKHTELRMFWEKNIKS